MGKRESEVTFEGGQRGRVHRPCQLRVVEVDGDQLADSKVT